jgi:hypothetical protein
MFWSGTIVVALIAALFFTVYKIRRVTQEQRQRSAERESSLMLALQKGSSARPIAAAGAAKPKPAAPPAPGVHGALVRRSNILTDAQRLLYPVLRAALPEHLIMAHVRIVDLLEPESAGSVQDGRLRELLQERLDFVVCDSTLVPVAAVVVYAHGIANVPDESRKTEALRELGLRFLRLRADSLPDPVATRNLVLS